MRVVDRTADRHFRGVETPSRAFRSRHTGHITARNDAKTGAETAFAWPTNSRPRFGDCSSTRYRRQSSRRCRFFLPCSGIRHRGAFRWQFSTFSATAAPFDVDYCVLSWRLREKPNGSTSRRFGTLARSAPPASRPRPRPAQTPCETVGRRRRPDHDAKPRMNAYRPACVDPEALEIREPASADRIRYVSLDPLFHRNPRPPIRH